MQISENLSLVLFLFLLELNSQLFDKSSSCPDTNSWPGLGVWRSSPCDTLDASQRPWVSGLDKQKNKSSRYASSPNGLLDRTERRPWGRDLEMVGWNITCWRVRVQCHLKWLLSFQTWRNININNKSVLYIELSPTTLHSLFYLLAWVRRHYKLI